MYNADGSRSEMCGNGIRCVAKYVYDNHLTDYSICKNHGYIVGEVYECPDCGEKTEVYSRITGYYRPIQHWNDGKTQEFADRKEYNIYTSRLKHEGPMVEMNHPKAETAATAATPAETVAEAPAASGIPTMYVKDHCPKCKGAEQRFKLGGIEYNEVNCSANMDIARELNIQFTPTIIDPDGTRYEGDNAAADWIKAHAEG